MKNILYFVILIILFSLNTFPQTNPANDEDVVKISTNLIQIDITVTDTKGNIINDVRPEEVEIYENGQKQQISNFSFVSSSNQINENTLKTKEALNIPTQSIPLKSAQVRRTIALVVDDLTLSFESISFVRQALKKFVNEQMQEGDLVAIIRTSAGMGALQQFTSDKRILYAAIEKVRWYPFGNGLSSAFAPLDKLPLGNADQVKLQQEKEKQSIDFRESIFATGTLGAVNYVVRGMKNLPGRKSLMVLSDGFALYTKDDSGSPENTRVLDSINRLVDAANRASVVINTMDARGLQTTGLKANDDTDRRTSDQVAQEMTDRGQKLIDTQAGLIYLAQQTGGQSIINNNDLSSSIRKILDDQSYYLIGYQPGDETFDPNKGRFNKLEVKVNRKNVKVRYRSSFFNITDNEISALPSLPSNQSPQKQILGALMSPFSNNDISLQLNVVFANDLKEGSYIKPLIHIDGKDLKYISDSNNNKKAVFDIVGIIFGVNGEIVDQIAKSYTFIPKSEDFQTILEKGFVYQMKFPIKNSGAYQFRIAIRDEQTGKLGSASQFLEIPNLKKNLLTLSSIILDSTPDKDLNEASPGSFNNLLNDISMKRFKKGAILRYELEVYNAKLDKTKNVQLQTQIKIYHDGKIFLEGSPKAFNPDNQIDLRQINVNGALSLGGKIPIGDYILQVNVIDALAEDKHKYSSQLVQFEVVE